MAILGGSPLGLIGVTSNPIGGYSTFNGGKTRNVAVNSYNKSQGYSLFSGRRRLRAWPEIKQISGTYPLGKDNKDFVEYDTSGLATVDFEKMRKDGKGDTYTQKTLHNNDVYDTSVLNLIEKLAGTKAALRPADFAYLKNLGVYPNNRLVIARRFATPTEPNIMVKDKGLGSYSTLVTWFGNDDDIPVTITFGEKWSEAKADFTNLLNSVGEDFGRKSESVGLGDLLGKAMGAVPLPGFTEIFQREFLKGIGLLEGDSGFPTGNPNLIKEAKARTTVGYGEAGSGLTAVISLQFDTEYELKFISGIDPTMVWMDIIGMVLRFGTSESSNYGLSKAFSAKLKRWAANPNNILSEMIASIRGVLDTVKEEVGKKIHAVWEEATKKAEELMKEDEKVGGEEDGNLDKILAKKISTASRKLLDKLVNVGDDILAGTILKYRTEVIGIVNSLTGAPSTPWHITIGNPLRPLFCSGDMLTQDVAIKFGPQLAFNDLPSSIKVSCTLVNARNLGMQEIMARFNSGYLRTVDVQKTFYETEQKITTGADGKAKITFDTIGQFAYEGSTAEKTPETKAPADVKKPEEPVKTEPAKTEPAKTEPAKTEPKKDEKNEQKKGTSKKEGTKEKKPPVVKNPKKAQPKK